MTTTIEESVTDEYTSEFAYVFDADPALPFDTVNFCKEDETGNIPVVYQTTVTELVLNYASAYQRPDDLLIHDPQAILTARRIAMSLRLAAERLEAFIGTEESNP